MHLFRAIKILGMESIVGDNNICYSDNPKKYAYLDWSNSIDGGERAALDGEFTADELEAVAWWMKQFKLECILEYKGKIMQPSFVHKGRIYGKDI